MSTAREAPRRWLRVALVALAASVGAGSSGAQDLDEVTGRYRDPRSASYWAIIPGGGHLYSGEYDKGVALLGGSIAALLVGRHASRERCALFDDVDLVSNQLTVVRACERHRGWFTLGVVTASGLWIAGIFDAADSAHRANFRNGWTSALPLGVDVALLPDGPGAVITARLTFR